MRLAAGVAAVDVGCSVTGTLVSPSAICSSIVGYLLACLAAARAGIDATHAQADCGGAAAAADLSA
jgi:hypothetical protein